jgi:Tfp pilus assembly protein PilX
MMIKRPNQMNRLSGQRGMALLVVTILLLLVATIGTLMVGRVGLMEQKVVGSDVRNKEVYSAALGGLEYGKEWLTDNYVTTSWTDSDGDGDAEAGDTLVNSVTLAQTQQNADNYKHTLVMTLLTDFTNDINDPPVIIRIDSIATGGGDSQSGDTHVTKTVSEEVMVGRIRTFPPSTTPSGGLTVETPPILIEGCTDTTNTITGQPDVVYDHPNGIAVGTTRGLDSDGDGVADRTVEDCVDITVINNHLNLCSYTGTCEDADDFVAGGGEFRQGLSQPQSLWSTIFGDITKADLRVLERLNPSHVLVVDSTYPHYPSDQPSWNGNTWHRPLPTGMTAAGPALSMEPVILYFDQSVGCPPINGGTPIFGIVYYEKVNCGNQGWGGGVIFGTMAKAGDLSKLNANAVIVQTALDFGGAGSGPGGTVPGGPPGSIPKVSEIPGSWRDY